MAHELAYIARGQLRLLDEGAKRAEDFDSPFAAQVRERAASSQRRQAWREEGTGFASMMARNARQRAGGGTDVRFTTVARGLEPGSLLHALDTGAVSGLFSVDASGRERRIFHTERFDVRHVSARPEDETLACAVSHGHQANIAIVGIAGNDLQEITEGDSIDLAPSWVPGSRRRLVYQSAGLARGADAARGTAPFAIQQLDLETGALETLVEDESRDLLLPRMSADGALHFIRCPHRPPVAGVGERLVSVITWPVRFGRGVFAFLDMFAQIRKGGARPRPAFDGGRTDDDVRMKDLLLRGELGSDGDDADDPSERDPKHVSSSWELVRRDAAGAEEILARGAFAFDLAPDGTIAWTDGHRVCVRRPDGRTDELVKDRLVHDVAWLA